VSTGLLLQAFCQKFFHKTERKGLFGTLQPPKQAGRKVYDATGQFMLEVQAELARKLHDRIQNAF